MRLASVGGGSTLLDPPESILSRNKTQSASRLSDTDFSVATDAS